MRIQSGFNNTQHFGTLITRPKLQRQAAKNEELKTTLDSADEQLKNTEKWDLVLDISKTGKLHPVFMNKETNQIFGPSLNLGFRAGNHSIVRSFVAGPEQDSEYKAILLEHKDSESAAQTFEYLENLNNIDNRQKGVADYKKIIERAVLVTKELDNTVRFDIEENSLQ